MSNKAGPEDCPLLVFGPQALSASPSTFESFRSKSRATQTQAWLTEVLASLPSCWKSFMKAFPKYAVRDSSTEMLVDLGHWFKSGDATTLKALYQEANRGEALPNIILSPLVVIIHLMEYIKFLETGLPLYTAATRLARPLPDADAGQAEKVVLGFCTGILSASAVSLSGTNITRVREHGAAAIRLAMIIGGIVDKQGALDPSGPAVALSASWNSSQAYDGMKQVLANFSEVRTSLRRFLKHEN